MMELILVAISVIIGLISIYFLFFNTKAVTIPEKAVGAVRISPAPKQQEKKENKKKDSNNKKKHRQSKETQEIKYDDDATKHRVVTQEEETAIFKQYLGVEQEKNPQHPFAVKEKEQKKEKVERKMPTQKQIEKDIERGFTIVTKKGPPPLTAEQKKEREEARRREEEERQREKQERQERMERIQKRKEQITVKEVSQDQIKSTLEKQKEAKNAKIMERNKTAGGVVKNYVAPKTDEPLASKSWAASVSVGPISEGGVDNFAVADNADYPRLTADQSSQLPQPPQPQPILVE